MLLLGSGQRPLLQKAATAAFTEGSLSPKVAFYAHKWPVGVMLCAPIPRSSPNAYNTGAAAAGMMFSIVGRRRSNDWEHMR